MSGAGRDPSPGGDPRASYWGEPAPARPGSVSVVIATIVLILFGLFLLLVAGGLLLAVGTFRATDFSAYGLGAPEAGVFTNAASVVGATLLAFAIGHLVGALGILGRRTWGRVLGLIAAIIGTLLALLGPAVSPRRAMSRAGRPARNRPVGS